MRLIDMESENDGCPIATEDGALLGVYAYDTKEEAVEAWNRRGKKPFYRKKKWKNIYWDIPYCPHCKQELGLEDALEKPEKCSECGRPLEWDDKENDE